LAGGNTQKRGLTHTNFTGTINIGGVPGGVNGGRLALSRQAQGAGGIITNWSNDKRIRE